MLYLEFLWDIAKTSFRGLAANKMRSFLTMLGIIIGIGAVTLVMSIGSSAENLITSQVTQLGTNLIGVLPGKSEDDGPPAAVFGATVTTLKRKDAKAIADLPDIAAATSYATGRSTVAYGNQAELFDFSGVSPDYIKVEDTSLVKGRFFTQREQDSFSRVAVLGYRVKEDLFGQHNSIGQQIRIKNRTFKVIGVMEERGASLFGNFDNKIFIPVTTAQKTLLGINHVNLIRAKMTEGANDKQVEQEIEKLLRFRHNISDPSKDDFSVRSMAQMLDILKSVTGAIRGFLIIVVAISLIVGGIGIMNIMLVSLSERIREVGLRKAVGASDSNIQIQFLTESTFLSSFGGVIGIAGGIAVGIASSYLIRFFTTFNWQFIIFPYQIIVAILVASFVGVVFGFYPSYRAAKLDPIDALRYE